MGEQLPHSGKPNGFEYTNRNNNTQNKTNSNDNKNKNEKDDDLIIEGNTVYEIDRECYERLKRQKKR